MLSAAHFSLTLPGIEAADEIYGAVSVAAGVAFGGDAARGFSVKTGVSIQNSPEGLAVAVSMIGLGHSRVKAFLVTFAAGAKLCIVSHEIVPDTHRNGPQDRATVGRLFGLILIMVFDVTHG